MTGSMPEVGPAGRNVIVNVDRLRTERGLSLNKLSAALDKAGRIIPPLGLSRFLKGERRIDPDELLAFAEVLQVTPDVLLAPPGEAAGDPLPEHAASAAARQLADRIGALLEAAGDPAARDFATGAVDRALRRVQIEVEDLLADPREDRLRRSS